MSEIQDRLVSFQIAFLLSSVILLITPTSYGSNETDPLALLSFKSMISQDPYGVLNSWNTSHHFCDWEGVTCGKRHQRVTAVNLVSRSLVGSLSPHVGNLSFLRSFELYNNTFKGDIPHELGGLFRLQLLDLGANKFEGLIPANLSHCSNLVRLFLDVNNLFGKIPEEVSTLSKLKVLQVDENNLTGGIPPSIGNMSSMTVFSVVSNPLGGSIPDQLGQLKSLQKLYLGTCSLSGFIPPSLYNLSQLRDFSMGENQLYGSLPQTLGSMLPHLLLVQLNDNMLSGSLPLSISNCSDLEKLQLATNNFKGKIKNIFSQLRNIVLISIAENKFGSGEADEMKFIDSMANCSKLKQLDLAFNELEGELPNSLGNLSVQLNYLSLGENLLYGDLPSSLGNLVGINYLELISNQFIGTIPKNIGKLHKLQKLALSENHFSGSIPVSIGNLSLLNELYLNLNRLEGPIPSSLGNIQDLLLLSLFQNNLSGNMPKEVFKLSSLTILDLSQNKFIGSLPSEIGNLRNLNELYLSDNDLSGNIPRSLGACTSLVVLNLAGNSFQGMLLPELSSLRGVIDLDLSRNNFSGQIPNFLERFSLANLNLSFNELEGEVPVKGVFANSSAISVYGNSRLCGGLSILQLSKCTIKQPKKQDKKVHLIILLISTVCVLFFVFISLGIVLICYKKKKTSQGSKSLLNGQFLQVSYNDLLKATDGFSEENLIGVGGFSSVYKGTLVKVEVLVAIKVLNLLNRGAYKSFMAECEALRNIRHRNLLKIVTACSSVDFQGNDFKALVYEFMPKGSLEYWLHSGPGTQRLSLLQVMNVITDVACALDYLHNRCETPIVHCDIKPSNILFDGNMTAHVADFGISRFLETNTERTSSHGIRGTIGYAPPEYGLGSEISTNGDVYSFGILLLEIMTGKRPTDEMFDENLNLHKFVSMALPNHAADIMDAVLLNYNEEEATRRYNMGNPFHAEKIEECLLSVLNIGVVCSLESPENRMEIKNVYLELQKIRGVIQKIGT